MAEEPTREVMIERQNQILKTLEQLVPKINELSEWKRDCENGRRIIFWIVGSIGAVGSSVWAWVNIFKTVVPKQ